MKHIADKVCSCEYCQMLDCMFGDPQLTKWEKEFINSVSRQGWYREDYSDKEKVVIKRIFRVQKDLYTRIII